MTDITDKYEKFKVPYSTNEKHSADEFDPKENGGLDNPDNRHKDKVLDDICDTHPGSPMCKVFDCWSSGSFSDFRESAANELSNKQFFMVVFL